MLISEGGGSTLLTRTTRACPLRAEEAVALAARPGPNPQSSATRDFRFDNERVKVKVL
jgi:hypothetical protein